MAAESNEYLVVHARTLYGGTTFASEEEALAHAEKMVRDDKSPRIVVQLIVQYDADPTPAVHVRSFREPTPTQEQSR